MRKYNIKGTTTEPYHPQQNPSERVILDIKAGAQTLLGCTGADSRAWFKVMEFYSYLHNRKACQWLAAKVKHSSVNDALRKVVNVKK